MVVNGRMVILFGLRLGFVGFLVRNLTEDVFGGLWGVLVFSVGMFGVLFEWGRVIIVCRSRRYN